MPRKMKEKQVWLPVKRLSVNEGGISEAYHLKRVSDGSIWYAVRFKEHEEFLKEILSRLKLLVTTITPVPNFSQVLKSLVTKGCRNWLSNMPQWLIHIRFPILALLAQYYSAVCTARKKHADRTVGIKAEIETLKDRSSSMAHRSDLSLLSVNKLCRRLQERELPRACNYPTRRTDYRTWVQPL
jgi:hypothetical protein